MIRHLRWVRFRSHQVARLRNRRPWNPSAIDAVCSMPCLLAYPEKPCDQNNMPTKPTLTRFWPPSILRSLLCHHFRARSSMILSNIIPQKFGNSKHCRMLPWSRDPHARLQLRKNLGMSGPADSAAPVCRVFARSHWKLEAVSYHMAIGAS